VYVTNSGSNSVSVINGATNSVIATIDVGSYPYGAVFDSSNGYVYVTNYFSGTVSIISTSALIIKHYTVTFTESGLPSGTSWYVNITGQTSSGPITSSTYTASLINGTYSYTVSTSDKTYSPSPSSGSFTVNGGSVSKSVSFPLVKYTVTFTESGLPSGTSWSVTFNGTTESSTTNTITFTAANGTYSYSIGSVSGYTVSPSSGNITVNGKNISRDTIFTASSGISSTELYAIIGAVIAVAVIGSVVAITRKRR
jgi:YVTN family beta-propeller protein